MIPSLLGAGHALPERVLESTEVEGRYGFPIGWAAKHVGIERRHVAETQQLSWHLGAEAGAMAISRAGLHAQDIDLLLVHSSVPELAYPDPAWLIARELGLREDIPVLGLRVQCAGFVAALGVVNAYVRSGLAQRVLVVCAERMFRPTQGYDRAALLFGDGAGAALFGASEGPGLRHLSVRQLPQHADRCIQVSGVLEPEERPFVSAELGQTQNAAYWEGGHIFEHAVTCMGEDALAAMRACGLSVDGVHHFLFHQANAKILRSLARNFDLPEARMPCHISELGNLSSASVPVLLSQGMESGRILPGQTLLLGAFGAGYTVATAVLDLP